MTIEAAVDVHSARVDNAVAVVAVVAVEVGDVYSQRERRCTQPPSTVRTRALTIECVEGEN